MSERHDPVGAADEPGDERGKSSRASLPTDSVSFGPSCLSGIWSVFTSQPGLGVVLIGLDGRIEYVNESFVKDYIPLQQLVGRLITDFVAEPVAIGIRSAIDKVAGTDTLLIRKLVFKGYATQVTYRWLADGSGGTGSVLITLQQGFPEPGESKDIEVERATWIDLGRLSVLTIRELEVLALIGEGLRVKEVGAALHRSPKTIESHLSSIYRKVKSSDRAVLMRIAGEAGLDLEMVSRIRIEAIRLDENEKQQE